MFAFNFSRGLRLYSFAVVVAFCGLTEVSANTANDDATRNAGQGSPIWAQQVLSSSSRAPVAKVVSTATADVVLISGGYNEGFRDGMSCEVYRGNELIAELMIVRCETERSAALITALKAGMGIVPGDVANIKTVHPF